MEKVKGPPEWNLKLWTSTNKNLALHKAVCAQPPYLKVSEAIKNCF